MPRIVEFRDLPLGVWEKFVIAVLQKNAVPSGAFCITEELATTYNAVWETHRENKVNHLIFKNDADFVMFLLRWS